jgi:hypothetical protein
MSGGRFVQRLFLRDSDGAVLDDLGAPLAQFFPSELAQYGAQLTATGTAMSTPGEFVGLVVNAYSGGPQTIVVRDSVNNSGPIIATFVVSGVGFYPWGGDWTTPGGGNRTRLALTAGAHFTITGGTSRTVRAAFA